MLDIIKNPNEILRKKSEPIDLNKIKDSSFKKLLKEMTETMFKKDGIGLAAPQIGKNIRLIIINKNNRGMVMINPEITKKSWAKEIEPEGCLSVVNEKDEIYYLPVARHKKINCTYFDEKGKKQKIEAKKLMARVIQHETDHLNGILFIDRAEKNTK
jgi:peptide deformylase